MIRAYSVLYNRLDLIEKQAELMRRFVPGAQYVAVNNGPDRHANALALEKMGILHLEVYEDGDGMPSMSHGRAMNAAWRNAEKCGCAALLLEQDVFPIKPIDLSAEVAEAYICGHLRTYAEPENPQNTASYFFPGLIYLSRAVPLPDLIDFRPGAQHGISCDTGAAMDAYLSANHGLPVKEWAERQWQPGKQWHIYNDQWVHFWHSSGWIDKGQKWHEDIKEELQRITDGVYAAGKN